MEQVRVKIGFSQMFFIHDFFEFTEELGANYICVRFSNYKPFN